MTNRTFRGLPIDLEYTAPGTYALVRVDPERGNEHYELCLMLRSAPDDALWESADGDAAVAS